MARRSLFFKSKHKSNHYFVSFILTILLLLPNILVTTKRQFQKTHRELNDLLESAHFFENGSFNNYYYMRTPSSHLLSGHTPSYQSPNECSSIVDYLY